ncbi:MAG: c-type cytochrome biogenesis protein CcmI [Pirellulales bacterium]|nr:c-type cytochrome biogenesis protein CcmI [Pirellulales bacterium]
MLIAAAVLLVALAFAVPLLIRPSDIPEPPAVSPTLHLEERKAAIYENLRDLQAEYRMGKLSDEDYQDTKKDLQRDLAQVMAEIEAIDKGAEPAAGAAS